jgi:hypothetical protein
LRPSIPGIELGEIVGRGASSVVYAAVQQPFGRTVAVKILSIPGRSDVADALFATECRMLGRLDSHPDIVTVFDAGTTGDGDPYLVMEHLPGGTLAQRLRDRGRMAPDEVLPIAIRLCGALATAHRNGIVHGDVKPQNVLWSAADLPALADFGIARLRSTTMSTGIAVFTPLHAAPELFDGRRPTEVTDVYGLGSTIFELLDGRPAAGEDGETPLTVVGRIARRECRSLDPDVVPAPLVEVVERAMAYEPDDRYPTVEEMGAALQDVERALGLPPTRMVILDLPETTPASALDSVDRATSPPDDGAGRVAERQVAAGTVPPPGSTIHPITDGRGPRRGMRSGLLVAGAAIVVLAIGAVIVLSRGSDGEAAPTSTSTTTTVAPTPGVEERGDEAPGLQPDVTYAVEDAADTTPALDQALADLDAIAAPIGGAEQSVEGDLFKIASTPATVRYKTYHERTPPYCVGFMSRPMTVTGQWSRLWAPDPATFVSLVVLDFDETSEADEAYVALSLGQQPDADECFGFRKEWGVEDYDQLDIRRSDVPLVGLTDATRSNTFLRPAGPDYPGYLYSVAGIVQRDTTLVVFVVLTKPERQQIDPAALSQFLGNVLARLPG